MTVRLRLLKSLMLLAGLWLPPQGRAGDFCVDTVAELVSAVNQFESVADGLTLSIKVVQGTYVVGTQLDGAYYADGRSVGIKLLGGYTAGCAGRVLNPANTVIDGNNVGGAFHFSLSGDANALFQGLTFTRFVSDSQVVRLALGSGTSDEAHLAIRHCRFVGNSGINIARISGAQVRFVNNVVAGNTVPANEAAVVLEYTPLADTGIAANNNTIAHNGAGRGLKLEDVIEPSARTSEINNNLLWGHGGADLDLSTFDSLANILFVNGNTIADSVGLIPPGSGNNATNPQFVNVAALNFRTALNSPAQNSGIGYQTYGIPEKDLDGNNRVIGSGIDRGAYESTVDNGTTAFVTNTADNGSNASPSPGSLRAAIKAANAAGGPYRINFAIGTTCPQIIQMNTTMLDVTGKVTIDARTQNGWNGNSGYGHFDASLCVVLNGSGSTPYAFRVPAGAANASLAVHGLMMGGFSDAAIRLEDGRDHRISGNQFGAIPFVASNASAVRVTGASSGAFIGGFDDTAAVNLIAGSSSAGVFLDNAQGGSTVANNVIGFQTDGITQGGNQIGIYVFNSPGNVLRNNYIGWSDSTGVTLSGASSVGNIVQENFIGYDWTYGLPGNGSAGVSVIFAAHDNTIGAPLSANYGGNLIGRNLGPGVWISPSGGAGNRVLANQFFDNQFVDVDLGATGPTANQPGNPGTGPNRAQNHPLLGQAVRGNAANPAVSISGTLHSAPSSGYRIDVYLASSCDGSAAGRGTAEVFLGRSTVNTNVLGDASFQFLLPGNPPLNLDQVTATATSTATGDTSEIGNCIALSTASLPQQVFANGFE